MHRGTLLGLDIRFFRFPSVRLLSSILLFLYSSVLPVYGWVYPEHRDIAVRAVQRLDPAHRKTMDAMWALARTGHEARLSEAVIVDSLPEVPTQIDWGAWPAIGGDHSCSPTNMVDNVLNSDWILDVARITERLKRRLAATTIRADRVNYLRDQDIELQRADPEYATRAGSNNVHFLLARDSATESAHDYLQKSLKVGDEINAMSVWVWYHNRALAKAALLSNKSLTEQQRQQIALAALADEAFGLHFLEDSFAAGHVAGTWGTAAKRKGTHDYYNEHGLETTTWDGKNIVLLGDAYMRPEDADRASEAATASLVQLIEAFENRGVAAGVRFTRSPGNGLDLTTPDTLNVCSNNYVADAAVDPKLVDDFVTILKRTPISALKPGYGELPRFRAELGPFVGMSSAVRGASWHGGFSPDQTVPGGIGGLEMNARVGLGLDGIINETGDGLVFLEFGFSQDGASSMDIAENMRVLSGTDLTAAIPSRQAMIARIRMPFWLLPGDLILAAPLLLVSQDLYTQMAVVAGNGGVIPWQAGIVTTIGRFQFVLGREVGVYFYGYGKQENNIIIPPQDSSRAQVLTMRSIQVQAPIVEYRPFRTFSVDQSSSIVMQLYGSADIPTVWWDLKDRGNPVHLRTIFGLGLRIAFDWRYYL